MQAALTCSKMGHKVILCEKNERLGGVLRCEENVAFKKNLDYYLNQQAKCVEEDKNIELRLQTKVTPEYAEDLNADVIIAALGADQVVYAAGQKPLREETTALACCAPEFYMLGDCVTPQNITAATSTAYMTARNIGRDY